MKNDDIVLGEVIVIEKMHLLVKLESGYRGFVHISSVSDYFVSNLSSMFNIGEEYNFKILEVNNDTKKVKLDWKSIHPRFLKSPFKYEIKETKNGFKNISRNTEKEVKND